MATHPSSRRRQLGVTVLELMIGMTIGLIASVVIVQVYSQSEAHRRNTTGLAGSQQGGTIAAWQLLRDVRMAGSGLQHGQTLWGCRLQAWRDGTQMLPRSSDWPQPFGTYPRDLTLAPIVAFSSGGASPDSLLVMSARGGAAAAPLPASVVSDVQLDVPSSVGFQANDLLLMADMSSVTDCRIGQVASSFAPTAGVAAPKAIPTGAPSSGYNGPGGFSGLPGSNDYALFNLGATPSIVFYGITRRTLSSFDALAMNGLTSVGSQAENVENMQILYGVDDGTSGVANDNIIDRWVEPGSGAFTMTAMMSGSAAALQVKAVRIALVIRSTEAGQTDGPSQVVLFQDLPSALQVTVPIAAADRAYARQVYDMVIPLRNQWIALCSEYRRANAIPAAGSCG